MFFIATFFIFGAVVFLFFIAAWMSGLDPELMCSSVRVWASKDPEVRLFTVRNIPKTRAVIDSVSRPDLTRLFTWFILPCLYLLMPNDAVLTDAKWPDVRLRVHWHVFSFEADQLWSRTDCTAQSVCCCSIHFKAIWEVCMIKKHNLYKKSINMKSEMTALCWL